MSIQLRNDRRYISIDFEATGLDTVKDEPIQVGLVVADSDFRLIDSFSALIRPQRDIKELKHIVGYITGLSLDKLSDALSKEEL
jgi:DNA polymerase III epsilon subunit-like protein